MKAAPEPPMSPELQRVFDRVKALLLGEAQTDFEIGMEWNQLVDQGWAKLSPQGKPQDWWDAHLGGWCEARSAERCGRVVTHFDEAFVRQYGAPMLDAAITFCHTRYRVPRDPRNIPIKFIDADGQVVEKPFSQCTYTEVLLAAHPKHTKAPGHSQKPAPEPMPAPTMPVPGDLNEDQQKFIKQMRLDLSNELESVGGIQITAVPAKSGALYSFTMIPSKQLVETTDLLKRSTDSYGRLNGRIP